MTADPFRSLIESIVRDVLAEQPRPANDEYLSTSDAATIAKVTPATIRRWVRKRRLTRHEAGSRVRVKRDELERLLACNVTPIDVKLSPAERGTRRFG